MLLLLLFLPEQRCHIGNHLFAISPPFIIIMLMRTAPGYRSHNRLTRPPQGLQECGSQSRHDHCMRACFFLLDHTVMESQQRYHWNGNASTTM